MALGRKRDTSLAPEVEQRPVPLDQQLDTKTFARKRTGAAASITSLERGRLLWAQQRSLGRGPLRAISAILILGAKLLAGWRLRPFQVRWWVSLILQRMTRYFLLEHVIPA